MPIHEELDYLLRYTEWERSQWETWFRANGVETLGVGLGANADGRIANVGELVRHIFAAEQRYVERIQGLPLSDGTDVPPNDIDALFAFGRGTRQQFRRLLDRFPAERWSMPMDIQIGPRRAELQPKTMAVQSVTHELRHWAQIATLLRVAGYKPGSHDFLFSGIFERA